MKKKEYVKPEQRVVLLQHRTMLLAGSVTGVDSNLDDEDEFIFGGGGNGPGR